MWILFVYKLFLYYCSSFIPKVYIVNCLNIRNIGLQDNNLKVLMIIYVWLCNVYAYYAVVIFVLYTIMHCVHS